MATYNMEHEAQLIARKESLKFVEENLINATPFSDREQIREHAIRLAQVDGLYLEFGVYQGESLSKFSRLATGNNNRRFRFFPGFAGRLDISVSQRSIFSW